MRRIFLGLLTLGLVVGSAIAGDAIDVPDAIDKRIEAQEHHMDVLAKKIDDLLWYERVGDLAVIDKIRIYGPPPWKEDNPTAIGAGNPLKFYSYTFTPRERFGRKKLPLVILPHGGVHGDFTTYYAHIVRELLAQGYIVVAPEYRGSTGYGAGFYRSIDYGGREVEDCLAARDWAVENHPLVDADHVGILGWSHGGLIALMSAFNHPKNYRCAFAGVPVSDLVQRMGYMTQDYRDLYEAEYFIGQSANENLEEYKRRSPAWHADKLTIPLRIHTNIHDEDVNFIEVEHLIQALKAAGKDFEHEVSDVPGGHSFDRLDTPEAWRYRKKMYSFLARYLDPPRPNIDPGVRETGLAAP